MMIHLATLVAFAMMGFFVGGVLGAAAIVVPWVLVLAAFRWLQGHRSDATPGHTRQPRPSVYADIEEVISRLEDIAQDRNWDIGKRFEIARMACENPTTTFDELERRYDQGLKSALHQSRQVTSQQSNPDASV